MAKASQSLNSSVEHRGTTSLATAETQSGCRLVSTNSAARRHRRELLQVARCRSSGRRSSAVAYFIRRRSEALGASGRRHKPVAARVVVLCDTENNVMWHGQPPSASKVKLTDSMIPSGARV